MEARPITITDLDRREFVGELKYYLLTVVVPLNLMFGVFLLVPGGRHLSAIALLIDLLVYLTKFRPALDDLAHNHFYVRRGVLRAVKFRLSFEKFEYRLDGGPEVYSSVTSRYRPLLEHAVELVYAEKSHRIIRIRQT